MDPRDPQGGVLSCLAECAAVIGLTRPPPGSAELSLPKARVPQYPSPEFGTPRSRRQFADRLRSFYLGLGTQSWCGSVYDDRCSPLVCAQHGWTWHARDRQPRCAHCGAALPPPASSSDDDLEDWGRRLQSRHEESCIYHSAACPGPGFTKYEPGSLSEAQMQRWHGELRRALRALPAAEVHESCAAELLQRHADLREVAAMLGAELPVLRSGEAGARLGDAMDELCQGAEGCAVSLAVCGWQLRPASKRGGTPHLECPHCLKHMGIAVLIPPDSATQTTARHQSATRRFNPMQAHIPYCPYARVQVYDCKPRLLFCPVESDDENDQDTPLRRLAHRGCAFPELPQQPPSEREPAAGEGAPPAAAAAVTDLNGRNGREQKRQRLLRGWDWAVQALAHAQRLERGSGRRQARCEEHLVFINKLTSRQHLGELKPERLLRVRGVLAAATGGLVIASFWSVRWPLIMRRKRRLRAAGLLGAAAGGGGDGGGGVAHAPRAAPAASPAAPPAAASAPAAAPPAAARTAEAAGEKPAPTPTTPATPVGDKNSRTPEEEERARIARQKRLAQQQQLQKQKQKAAEAAAAAAKAAAAPAERPAAAANKPPGAPAAERPQPPAPPSSSGRAPAAAPAAPAAAPARAAGASSRSPGQSAGVKREYIVSFGGVPAVQAAGEKPGPPEAKRARAGAPAPSAAGEATLAALRSKLEVARQQKQQLQQQPSSDSDEVINDDDTSRG
eukprot:TRINITY_DN4354_c4_g1_i1.p1 TRINITY_DN4354_c4_g1~~TRINITY_DN4354_c4_g1_i1.p1  ORF type:complete len:752 (+),score=223.53 TRINITY_DN4354_c4_g1_i1:63-2258(+)